MPKMEEKMLFPEVKKDKGFGDLMKVVKGSSSRATIEALGMEITFGWIRTADGKKIFDEIYRSKEERQISGSMDIPQKLYNAMKDRARAVIKNHAEAKKNKARKRQLENRIKKQQPDLF